jgi:hypothetical protein
MLRVRMETLAAMGCPDSASKSVLARSLGNAQRAIAPALNEGAADILETSDFVHS